MDYLYPEELTKIFMTCNLVGGFFQRIEKLRKYAFASICVFGEDNNNVISGIWVWRGQELVFPVSCLLVLHNFPFCVFCCSIGGNPPICSHLTHLQLVPDWNVDAPSYKFEKLDPESDNTKLLVKEYFSWEGAFAHLGGKGFNRGKVFK